MFICRKKVRKLNADLGEWGWEDNGHPHNIPVSMKVLQTKLLKWVIKPPRAAVMILTLQASHREGVFLESPFHYPFSVNQMLLPTPSAEHCKMPRQKSNKLKNLLQEPTRNWHCFGKTAGSNACLQAQKPAIEACKRENTEIFKLTASGKQLAPFGQC